MDKRTKARELCLQALYQLDMRGNEAFDTLNDFFMEEEAENSSRRLAKEWTRGTWENLPQCDVLITASTIKWEFARLSIVDRSILRLAVYQLKFCPDVPPKVVINEAIELAKKFGTEKSPSFINGVLDAILKKMTPNPMLNDGQSVKSQK
jgi:transcription antitermination factor NusB